MSNIRAGLVYQAVHYFGDPSADPAKKRPETLGALAMLKMPNSLE